MKPILSFAALAAGVLVSACAVPVMPLSPGTAQVENSTRGLVFGRIQVVRDGYDQMAYSFGKEFGWWLTREDSGERFVVPALTHEGPFVVNLPAGRYRVTGLIYDEGAAVWEGELPATFTVSAGGATYLGTWEIQFVKVGMAGKVRGRVVDQLSKAQGELRETYTGAPKPISVALLDSARDGYFSIVEFRIGQ
ncbi:MAG: hypothetical protein Q7R68_11640 [Nitrospirales bacterium]|nr:hypothetical protein [Nitrospirales bacterium]